MRHYLKQLIIAAIAFYTAYTLIPTVSVGQNPKNILITIGGILLVSLIIQPIFSIILLPINFLTFGLVAFILNVALIFALIQFLPAFSIAPYDFPGANIGGFIVPAARLTQIATILAAATIITVVQKILHLIFEWSEEISSIIFE